MDSHNWQQTNEKNLDIAGDDLAKNRLAYIDNLKALVSEVQGWGQAQALNHALLGKISRLKNSSFNHTHNT